MTRVFITGTAGFIGFHLAKLLLDEGYEVHGYDAMTDYYDLRLKQARQDILETYQAFSSTVGWVEDERTLDAAIDTFQPDIIIHLAGQAGVRHSINNPRDFINSNIIGTFNIQEAAKRLKVRHLLLASSSSVYGANTKQPFTETDKADLQVSMYAVTKKTNESMGHTYAHLWGIPTTAFRFFTVYGPWGRPDLAYFKFVDAILAGRPIDIYNHGKLARDFTYVEDLVRGIRLLIDVPPETGEDKTSVEGDSLSPVAPFRVINIGNSEKIALMDFITAIEKAVGKEAIRNYLPMQPGDVHETWADSSLLKRLTGYAPKTALQDGMDKFVTWYRDYYKV